VLFADVRGYTTITEQLSPAQVPAFVNRFYATASSSLLAHEALLGQIEGDNVMALFVPGFAGADYKAKAVEGARSLLAAVGSSSDLGLDVGVGVASGEEFVGNVGGGGYKDFTAVGDVTNLAARLTAAARGGEIILEASTYEAVASRYPAAESRMLDLKGRSAPVAAFVIPG
jgi:adenylate cyclase